MNAMPNAMPNADPITPLPAGVARRAVEWLVELSDRELPAERWAAWRSWRDAHPDHERAWQRIETVNGRLRELGRPMPADLARTALLAPDSPARRRVIGSLVLLVFGGGAAWRLEQVPAWQARHADHRTAIGETRRIELADGTVLVLNTDSAADVSLSADQRRVRLIAGELLVTTARDRRPFRVDTRHGAAHALGTRYSVRVDDGGTDVAVFDGAVRVEPRRATASARLLGAGQRARFDDDGAEPTSPASTDAIAWADGILVVRGMRVDALLSELGRYLPLALSCDPSVAGLRVSGSFPIADPDKALQTLTTMLSLRSQRQTARWPWQRDTLRLVADPARKPT